MDFNQNNKTQSSILKHKISASPQHLGNMEVNAPQVISGRGKHIHHTLNNLINKSGKTHFLLLNYCQGKNVFLGIYSDTLERCYRHTDELRYWHYTAR